MSALSPTSACCPAHDALPINSVGRFTDLVLVKGEGSYISTDCGRKFLDFTSGASCSVFWRGLAELTSRIWAGIGVVNLSHCHPKVTKAAQEQCATLVHGQVNLGFNKPYLGLIEKLIPVMPHETLDTFFFW